MAGAMIFGLVSVSGWSAPSFDFAQDRSLEWIWMEPSLSFIKGETVRYTIESEYTTMVNQKEVVRRNPSKTMVFLIADRTGEDHPQYELASGDPTQPESQVAMYAGVIFDQLSNLLPPRPVQVGEGYQKIRGIGIPGPGPAAKKIIIDRKGELTERGQIKELTGQRRYDAKVLGWELIKDHPCLLVEGTVTDQMNSGTATTQRAELGFSPTLGRMIRATIRHARGHTTYQLADRLPEGPRIQEPPKGEAKIELTALLSGNQERALEWMSWVKHLRDPKKGESVSLSLRSGGDPGFIEVSPGRFWSAEFLRIKAEAALRLRSGQTVRQGIGQRSEVSRSWEDLRGWREAWDEGHFTSPIALSMTWGWPGPARDLAAAGNLKSRFLPSGPWQAFVTLTLPEKWERRPLNPVVGTGRQGEPLWVINGEEWRQLGVASSWTNRWRPVWTNGSDALFADRGEISTRRLGGWSPSNPDDLEILSMELSDQFAPWRVVPDMTGGRTLYMIGQQNSGSPQLVWSAWDVEHRRWRFRQKRLNTLVIPENQRTRAVVTLARDEATQICVFAWSSGLIMVADGETGLVKWAVRTEGDPWVKGGTVSLVGDTVVWWDGVHKRLTGLDAETGDKRWGREIPRSQGVLGSDAERVYIGEENRLVGIQGKDGRTIWSQRFPGSPRAKTVFISGGNLWVGQGLVWWSEQGKAVGLESATGQVFAQCDLGKGKTWVVGDSQARDRLWVVTPETLQGWGPSSKGPTRGP